MSLTLGDNFSYQGAKPLDARLKYDTVASMKAVADSTMYDGCLAYCTEADKTYQWKSSNTADSTLGKWREFSSGSGGGGTSEPTIINKTLTTAGWSNKQQTINFTGYDTDLGGVMGVPHTATAAQKEAYSEAIVNVVSQSGTSFTFSCENVPEIDLPVTLYAGGGGAGGGSADFPEGGTTGQVLAKASNDDNDVEWKTIDADKTQYTTMPTASVDNLGQIVQYVGETTVTEPIYMKGLFYQCVSDGESTPTYSWEQADVQSYPEADLDNVFASGFPVASVSGGSNPVGTIIQFYGLNAPDGYLACDGSTYNRVDYPTLAQHLTSQFSDLVGDGTTTFKVPDLRGEFLRGAGTNSHANQGSGGAVGVHQDGTKHIKIASDNVISHPYEGFTNIASINADTYNAGTAYHPNASSRDSSVDTNVGIYTSRPTNTSLLCCIKATPQGHQYSEKEQIVGSWVNGDTIYEKSFILGITSLEKDAWVDTSVDGSNIAAIIDGKFIRTNPNPTAVVPLVCNLQVSVNYETHKVRINPPIVLSSCANGYITIQYTKLS